MTSAQQEKKNRKGQAGERQEEKQLLLQTGQGGIRDGGGEREDSWTVYSTWSPGV